MRRYYHSGGSSCGRQSTAACSTPALLLISPVDTCPRSPAVSTSVGCHHICRRRPVPSPCSTISSQVCPNASIWCSCFFRPKSTRMRKLNTSYKMDGLRKKFPNHTEIAYRDAVSKLKYLLAESYAPKIALTKPLMIAYNKRACKENVPLQIEEFGDDTDAQSVTSEFSKKAPSVQGKYYPSRLSKYLPASNVYSHGNERIALPPAELLTFIERQEDYIQQLERESSYCKEELKNLIDKVREVVAENENLQDKTKTGFFKAVLDTYSQNVNEDAKLKFSEGTRISQKSPVSRGVKILEGPSIVFESRITELEAQLTQARLELQKAREDNHQGNLDKLQSSSGGGRFQDLDGSRVEFELERALRDKRDLEARVEELQHELAKSRIVSRDSELELKAKRATEAAEQAEFDKAQVEVEVRRLKDELERRQEKLREALQDTNRRIIEEKQQAERRFSQQMEQLTADAASHWEAASKSHLESEKYKREIADLKRELSQKISYIDDLKKEMQAKAVKIQEEFNAAVAERDASQEEVSTTKLTAERNERLARQEQRRLQAEINSYKSRLERADADLVHARRENLRLKDEIAALEKEINLNKIIEETRVGVQPSKQEQAGKEEKDTAEKELESLIFNLESKQAKTVANLEDTLQKQAVLVSRLTTECQSLTQRLEDNDQKHKQEMDSLQSSIEYLLNNLREPNDHQEQITDDGSLTILNTEKTFSGLIDDGNKEKNNNEITQGTYNSKLNLQPRQKYKNSSQDEIKFEETGGNHISTLTPQKAEEISLDQNYLGDNYPADYTQEHYNQYASYDSSQYQEYFNQQYSQDHQYPQNQTFLPEEQFLEKDNFQA